MSTDELINLWHSGATARQIAKAAGCSVPTMNQRIIALREQGLIGYRRQPLSPEHPRRKLASLKRSAIATLAREGKSNKEIAAKVGMAVMSVSVIAAEARRSMYEEMIEKMGNE